LLALGTMAMPGAEELIEARVLVRPAYLAIFGSLTAYWGGRELRIRREFELLHLLGQPPNFRRASESTSSEALDRLRELDHAHHAFLVMEREASCAVYSSGLSAHPVTPLTEAAREMLLGAPD